MSTRQGSRSIDEFLRSLNGRIQSMAAAHTLLSKSGWQSVGLDALVRNQLAPYATDTNVTISGIDVMLIAAEIQAVARVLHELVTNAAKYGALSNDTGRVALDWEVIDENLKRKLRMIWRETGGPPVTAPVQRGFGSRLIERSARDQLGGEATVDFLPHGVVYTVICSLEEPG